MKPLNDEMVQRVAQRFRTLGDPARIRLLLALQAGEANVSQLADQLGLGLPSVSKHLALLRDEGLVQVQRRGTQAIYAIRDPDLDALCGLVCGSIRRQVAAQHKALVRA